MNNKEYSPLFVSEQITKWLEYLRQLDYDNAEKCRNEIQILLPFMNPDDRVITYFNLVDHKHYLSVASKVTNIDQLNQPSSSDNALQFLYLDYLGQAAFHKKDYVKAIGYYSSAEQTLSTNCELEKAEFYKRVGTSYYRIDQNVFALSYIKQAVEIFKKHPDYKEIELNCYILIGGIYDDFSEPRLADKIYQQALQSSSPFPLTKALILRALGSSNLKSGNDHAAVKYFNESLGIKNSDPMISSKTKIDLAQALYNLSNNTDALKILSEGYEELLVDRNTEYLCRANTLNALFNDYDLTVINEQLNKLLTEKLYFEASELAYEVAKFHKNKGEYATVIEYIEKANTFKNKSNLLLVKEEVEAL